MNNSILQRNMAALACLLLVQTSLITAILIPKKPENSTLTDKEWITLNYTTRSSKPPHKRERKIFPVASKPINRTPREHTIMEALPHFLAPQTPLIAAYSFPYAGPDLVLKATLLHCAGELLAKNSDESEEALRKTIDEINNFEMPDEVTNLPFFRHRLYVPKGRTFSDYIDNIRRLYAINREEGFINKKNIIALQNELDTRKILG